MEDHPPQACISAGMSWYTYSVGQGQGLPFLAAGQWGAILRSQESPNSLSWPLLQQGTLLETGGRISIYEASSLRNILSQHHRGTPPSYSQASPLKGRGHLGWVSRGGSPGTTVGMCPRSRSLRRMHPLASNVAFILHLGLHPSSA